MPWYSARVRGWSHVELAHHVDEFDPKRCGARTVGKRWLATASNTLIFEKSDEEIESALIASVNELMSRGANRLVVSLGRGQSHTRTRAGSSG